MIACSMHGAACALGPSIRSNLPSPQPAPAICMHAGLQVKGKVKRPTRPDDAERNAQVQLLQEQISKYINRWVTFSYSPLC